MAAPNVPWGTDGVVSMPQPLETTDTAMVDFRGFCFTPDGIRINLTRSEREDLLLSAYRPEVGHGQG
jgi:hypothetical protein